jgi:tetratricopeptide (TPR) repeat protein
LDGYTVIVTRKWHFACLLGALCFCSPAQTKSEPPQQGQGKIAQQSGAGAQPTQQHNDEAEPPEEDESVKPKVYAFDPLEAERNIRIGNFYMRQGKSNGYRAAVGRFEDATKYNPNSAEAFFKLGEAEEKLKSKEKAKAAFQRVVQMAPDSKFAKETKKKLSGS